MTRRGRPTICDVARRAGVSKGTVSFALNGRPRVAEETRQRISGAARVPGWAPGHRRGQDLVLQVVPGSDEEASYRRLAADGRGDGVFVLDCA